MSTFTSRWREKSRNLLQPHPLSLSELASLGDGGVAQAVWANFQPDLLAQAADNPVEARASQPAALPRPVNVDEERPRFRAPCLQPLPDGLSCGGHALDGFVQLERRTIPGRLH